MSAFEFEPSQCFPFRDKEVIRRSRAIPHDQIEKHPNPDFKIRVVKDEGLTAVSPKVTTLGPADVIAAKYRFDMHGITVGGSLNSWQRLMTRLVLHGPVTPRLPASILQTLRTDVYVTEKAAMNIEANWNIGY